MFYAVCDLIHAQIQEGWGWEGGPDPPEISQSYKVFSNTGPDPLQITKLPSQNSMLAI